MYLKKYYRTINVNIDEVLKNDNIKNNLLIDYGFGQKCEDILVNLIFKNKKNGTFLDIGAHDGIRFSNSYGFSLLGWKGICVEAHPDYYNICNNNRKNNLTKIVNFACSNTNSEIL